MGEATWQLPDTAGLDLEEAKELLRAAIRERRAHRSEKERADAAAAFAQHALEAVGDARCVSVYVSRPTEPGTLPLLEALHDRGVRLLLPVLGPRLERGWAEFRSIEDLQERAPGRPPEPSGPVLPGEAIAQAEVVLAPALAVDVRGTRLGQGGGWYDRVLKHLPAGRHVFALVHDDELVDDRFLPCSELDVPVDAVITPSQWFLLEGSVFQTEGMARLASR